MPKFKAGDRVAWVHNNPNKNDWRTLTVIGNKYKYNSVFVFVKDDTLGVGAISEEKLELIPPTTFEVGKKYRYKTGIAVALIEYISNERGKAVGYWNDLFQSTAVLPLDRFSEFEEYMTPPPEVWRGVFWAYGDYSVGTTDYSSEEEVINTFSKNDNFVKAIKLSK